VRIADLESRFHERLIAAHADLTKVSLRAGIDEMLAFYRDERVDGTDLGRDEDMLLYQWGARGDTDGVFFEIAIGRQVMFDDDDIRQLQLTFRFAPTPELDAIPADNEWCGSLEELDEFRASVTGSRVLEVASAQKPRAVTLHVDDA
jgi:hypothetical protein